MATEDPIWARARDDLVIADDQGRDVFLWEHADRVVRNCRWLLRQPDMPNAQVDWEALTAAALYHDAGWIVQLHEGNVLRTEILSRFTSDLQRELGAAMLEERLHKLLPSGVLQRAADCVRFFQRRDEDFPEARILFDADNLDEIGPLLLTQIVRRQGLEGKGVQAAIDYWARKKEYHFWEARIDEFCFESARAKARQRLQQCDRVMAELARQHQGQDLAGSYPNAERGQDPVGTETDAESGEPPDPPTPSPPRTGDIQHPSEDEDT